MFLRAQNLTLRLPGGDMDCVRFGAGSNTLILLPGLGDGLRTVKGTALPMALMYRTLAKGYTVYMFSRSSGLSEGYSTRDMAAELSRAMEHLQIAHADVIGVSMGGMIAQHLAADHPEKVGKLVLVVTCAGPNPTLTESIGKWIMLAEQGDHTALMDSNVRRIYSEAYYRKNRWLIPVIGRLTKPASYDRFLIQAKACLTHDTRERLSQIQSPTLVIGGEQDLALGADASRELAAAIPHAQLKMYAQWGHGLYEEAKDFQAVVTNFLADNR
ncbi:MAG: alpha/beta hydrolase [Clostridiales bacterium]|nr:alpha/beta hydrolase [Clostridiales bacterium]